ncbi:cytochrome d ubiquinol oxidase subunit II [Hyphomicrobium sp.]|uniref:cytochrome d ubiquinol oxidase subunit II n=1 Tax=Hyphomicrobium sp. TaxID=82 RepID=UPI001D4A8C34|nr:cytochrome d ubiquinol oxidase subunit II [Hyphomicrobium sp.]MBY0560342.1 cytochrome d ubiquinol oxidase subunit II [Hyphomicrobium sp.]
MGIDLPLIWALIIGFGLMMYVIMDGFDLGVGILFPFVPARSDRDLMVNSVAPIWDGNETWLVLGGAGLLAAFPVAYSVVLTALYLPIIAMLAGLILRGVAFEFRLSAERTPRHTWDTLFAFGSYLATFSQGVVLGTFIRGFPVTNRAYTGGPFDWLTPFSIFTGLALLFAYALLGATWLIIKTEGPLQERMRVLARPIVITLFVAIVIVSIWTPIEHRAIAERWFSFPNIILFSPVPVLVVLATLALLWAVQRDSHALPFVLALVLIFLGYSGLVISLWPNILPPSISIWDAASPPQSLGFTLVGALFIIPFILVYTAWAYSVFRGKVRAGEGYH